MIVVALITTSSNDTDTTTPTVITLPPQPHFDHWVRFVEDKDGCLNGGGWCSYQIIDSDAVDQTFTLSARTIATTKLNGRIVGVPWATNVLVNTSYTPCHTPDVPVSGQHPPRYMAERSARLLSTASLEIH